MLDFGKMFFSGLLVRKAQSLIVIQKVCSNGLYAKALKLLIKIRNHNTLFDIDDAEHFRQETLSYHFFLKNCQKISVGSQALREYCLQYNNHVFVQTSPVCDHGVKKVKRDEVLHIGWVGDFGNGNAVSQGFSHKASLYSLLFPQLRTITNPIKLSLIGIKNANDIPEIRAYFLDCPNIELHIPRNLDWEVDHWVYPLIASFDVGVSPMLDHPFNQAKSAFKAKQYLSCDVPVIASDVGENNQFVQDGINGVLCKNPDDFGKAICRFSKMSNEEYKSFRKSTTLRREAYALHTYSNRLIGCF